MPNRHWANIQGLRQILLREAQSAAGVGNTLRHALGFRLGVISQKSDDSGNKLDGWRCDSALPILNGPPINLQQLGKRLLKQVPLDSDLLEVLPNGPRLCRGLLRAFPTRGIRAT